MRELKKAYATQGFEIIGIAYDEKETLQDFLAEKGKLPWLNILDPDGAIGERLKITNFPTYLIIDKNGKHFASTNNVTETNALIAEKLGIEPITLSPK